MEQDGPPSAVALDFQYWYGAATVYTPEWREEASADYRRNWIDEGGVCEFAFDEETLEFRQPFAARHACRVGAPEDPPADAIVLRTEFWREDSAHTFAWFTKTTIQDGESVSEVASVRTRLYWPFASITANCFKAERCSFGLMWSPVDLNGSHTRRVAEVLQLERVAD